MDFLCNKNDYFTFELTLIVLHNHLNTQQTIFYIDLKIKQNAEWIHSNVLGTVRKDT